MLYGHYDDGERYAFFARAVLEIIPHIDFKPDIIHCNDWQTALTNVYYSLLYANSPGYEGIKTVFTIHNIGYQGVYGKELIDDVVGISHKDAGLLEYDGAVNLMKGGVECADRVTTVSPTYAKEILDPWYSHGLDGILRERSFKIKGILNGIDADYYNPETDRDIFANYSAENINGKHKNKRCLQEYLGLPAVFPETGNKGAPLIGIVSRLAEHKGFDLIKAVLEGLIAENDVQIAVLGSGDFEYEEFFKNLSVKYPDKLKVITGFFPDLAKKIYAGSDIFLMPSKSEPCGLSQMVALRYGSIPVVRETGGLKDSVTDSGGGEGNGFTFSSYNAHDMLHAIERAITGYGDKKGWDILVKRAMSCNFGWGSSANEYIKLYKELL